MTALIVLASIAAVFIAIGFIRASIGAKYDDSGFEATVRAACFTIKLFPRPDKPPKPPKPAKAKKEKPPKPKKEKPEGEKTNPLDMFGGLRNVIDLALEAIADFFAMVYTDRFVIDFVSAKKDDPAKAATLYGEACAAAGIISPLLDNNRNVKYYSIKLNVDFEAEKPKIAGELRVSVSVGRVVRFAFNKGFKVLKLILKNRKKGGARNGKAGIEYA